jgi:hypothetical protein
LVEPPVKGNFKDNKKNMKIGNELKGEKEPARYALFEREEKPGRSS